MQILTSTLDAFVEVGRSFSERKEAYLLSSFWVSMTNDAKVA
jgi:hypothetical protein